MKKTKPLSIILTALIIIATLFCFSACSGGGGTTASDGTSAASDGSAGNDSNAAPVSHKISPADVHQMLADSADFILVDVRTDSEYKDGRIDGAVSIPVDELEKRAAAELPDKDKMIVVYCRSGVRSANAAAILTGLGYTNVNDMGGINGWTYDTVSG